MERQEALNQLPGKIKVRVNEDRNGWVTLTPVNDDIKKMIAATNEYNHSYEIFLQDSQDVIELLVNYPKTRYRIPGTDYGEGYKIGRYTYEVNDNNVFYIDTWDYRHMVGGQSD